MLPFLVVTDLVRAAIALCLPFVTEVLQVYALGSQLQILPPKYLYAL